MEKTEGEIQRIKENRKAIALNGEWFNSFKEITDTIKIGDYVKLSYVIKGKFNNIRSIEVLEKAKPIVQESKSINAKIDTSTINTMLMCIKEIYLINKNLTIEEITDKIIASYKKLIL